MRSRKWSWLVVTMATPMAVYGLDQQVIYYGWGQRFEGVLYVSDGANEVDLVDARHMTPLYDGCEITTPVIIAGERRSRGSSSATSPSFRGTT